MLSSRLSYALPFACASAALVMALISQYAFGKHPCDLCIIQRYPYGAILLLSCVGVLFAPTQHTMRNRTIWLLIIVAFVTTSAIAAYHFGVEQGWVTGPKSCSVTATQGTSIDDLRTQIMGAPLVSCSDVGASFLGLSMAGWNALYGICCATISGWYRFVRNAKKGII